MATTAELRRSLKFINPKLFNKIIQLAESGLISAGAIGKHPEVVALNNGKEIKYGSIQRIITNEKGPKFFKDLTKVKQYFKIQELVGQKTFSIHKHNSWQFLQTDALHCLLIIREGINDQCIINNWHWGGEFSQSGLRTNVQKIFRNYFHKKKL